MTAAVHRELTSACTEAKAVTEVASEIIAEIMAGQIDDERASLNVDAASTMAADLTQLADRADAVAARITAAAPQADATLAAQAQSLVAAMFEMTEPARTIASKINAALADYHDDEPTARP